MSSLLEKRIDLGQDPIPEQPPEKRPKLEESAGNNSFSEGAKTADEDEDVDDSDWDDWQGEIAFCQYCNVDGHLTSCCSKRLKRGYACYHCYGPCKKKDGEDPYLHVGGEMVLECVLCGEIGQHWADECPYLSTGLEIPSKYQFIFSST